MGRFSSSWSPRKVGGGSRSQRFLARYNRWKSDAMWRQSTYSYPEKQFDKPFIICIAASEFDESSWNWGRLQNGRSITTASNDEVWLFSVRIINYMFGDAE